MKKIFVLLTVLSAFVLQADGLVADKKEHDLICGIQPYKNPRWMSEIELTNGKKLHFASVKCMMLFYYKNTKWHDLGYDKRPKDGEDFIKELRVQDYNTLKVIDAKKAYYIFGSHIMSPKGDDLIPFQYKKDAENFMKENGGHKILTWKNFKLNLFDLLNL
jgi:hypothetical protein